MAKMQKVITGLSLLAMFIVLPLNARNANLEYQTDLSLLLNKVHSHDYQDIQQARKLALKLNTAARQSNEVLTLLINAMQQNANKGLAKYLLPDLAMNQSQRVTEVAFSLLQSELISDQLIATELLSSRTNITANEKDKLLTIIINSLSSTKDVQVLDSLLMLLQTVNFVGQSNSEIINAIKPHCTSTSESIRSNSYFVIAQYAQNSPQLKCIVSALENDNQSDKNSAIMALSKTSIKDEFIHKAVKKFAGSVNESNENRHIAKQLLKSY